MGRRRRTGALDGGWGWMVVVGCLLGHFFLTGLARSIGVLYIAFKEMFGESDMATSVVQSLFNTLRMVLGPLVSMLCDRYTSRKVVMVGGLIFAVACMISAWAASLLFLILSFGILAGVGSAMIFTPMYIVLNQYFDKKKGKAMGLSTIGSGLGTVVLAPLQAVLLTTYGYFGAMLVVGALMLHTCVSGALFRPLDSQLNWEIEGNGDPDSNQSFDEDMDCKHQDEICTPDAETWIENAIIQGDEPDKMVASASQDKADHGLSMKSEVKVTVDTQSGCLAGCAKRLALLRSATYWLYALTMMSFPCAIQIVVVYVPSFMKQLGMSTTEGAAVIAISGGADMAGRILWGFVFDLAAVRKRRRLAHHVLGVLTSLTVLGFVFASSLVGFISIGVLWGLVEGGWHAQRATVGSEIVPKDQVSTSMGFIIFFQGIGNLIWPTLAGLLKDRLGSYSWCFVLGSSVIFVSSMALIVDYYLAELRRRRSNRIRLPDKSRVHTDYTCKRDDHL